MVCWGNAALTLAPAPVTLKFRSTPHPTRTYVTTDPVISYSHSICCSQPFGTSPLDGNDAPPFALSAAITMQGAGRVDRLILSFPASSTKTYSIEASADLKTWFTLESDIAGRGNIIERSYPAIGALQRFGYFRVRRK